MATWTIVLTATDAEESQLQEPVFSALATLRTALGNDGLMPYWTAVVTDTIGDEVVTVTPDPG